MTLSSSKKIITFIALFSTLFTGCSATKPLVVNNKTIGNNNLYVTLDKSYNIKEFSNKEIGRGFIVNNYEPFGFDTKFYKTSDTGSCLWYRKGKINSKYEDIEAIMHPSQALISIIILPLALPLGLDCSNYHTFNYKDFNDNMKELLPIKCKKKLLSNYDTLIENKHITENKINNETDKLNNNVDKLNSDIEKLNKNSLQKLDIIKSKYLATNVSRIPKSVKIIDKTGLYHNKKLPIMIEIYKNDFPEPQLLQDFNNFNYLNHSIYSKIVNDNFPCNTMSICISNMNKSIVSIQNEYYNDIKYIHNKKEQLEQIKWKEKQQRHAKLLKEDMKKYMILSKFYNLNNNLKESTVEVNKKGITKKIFYTVNIKSNKLPLNQKLLSTVTVRDINFSNVFPKYDNRDKNIEIIFNPHKHNYNLVNNTDKFIQIKSVSLYYDGNIYNLTLNKNNNVFATELPPQAKKKFGLYDNINDSNYINLTKKQAQKKNFKFGFAIKYTTEKQTNNITLYSQHKYNLYSLIKDI